MDKEVGWMRIPLQVGDKSYPMSKVTPGPFSRPPGLGRSITAADIETRDLDRS